MRHQANRQWYRLSQRIQNRGRAFDMERGSGYASVDAESIPLPELPREEPDVVNPELSDGSPRYTTLKPGKGEKEFEDIMRKERERVEAVLARRLDNFRTKEEGMAKAELEKRAQAAKGKLLEKLKGRMEDHREDRELGNAEWRARRCARIAEEMGLNNQAKEVLRKEKESKKGKGCRREFRGEKWEELGWSLSEHKGPKWTLTLKEEKCLREDLELPTGRGKLGKWVGRDPEDAVWLRGKLEEMRDLISRVGRRSVREEEVGEMLVIVMEKLGVLRRQMAVRMEVEERRGREP